MRTIKFRVWCKTRNPYMCYDVMVGNSNHYMILEKDGNKYYTLVNDNAVLMQFTGLHDKNGKEIYEGDIVKAYGLIYTIEFKYGAFIFVNEVYELDWRDIANKNKDYRLYEDVVENFEIIGNIYENPELL